MLLVFRDYTKISTETEMDGYGPQTRTEKKGLKKGGKGVIYSAKHVRLTEALATKPKVEGPKSTKPR